MPAFQSIVRKLLESQKVLSLLLFFGLCVFPRQILWAEIPPTNAEINSQAASVQGFISLIDVSLRSHPLLNPIASRAFESSTATSDSSVDIATVNRVVGLLLETKFLSNHSAAAKLLALQKEYWTYETATMLEEYFTQPEGLAQASNRKMQVFLPSATELHSYAVQGADESQTPKTRKLFKTYLTFHRTRKYFQLEQMTLEVLLRFLIQTDPENSDWLLEEDLQGRSSIALAVRQLLLDPTCSPTIIRRLETIPPPPLKTAAKANVKKPAPAPEIAEQGLTLDDLLLLLVPIAEASTTKWGLAWKAATTSRAKQIWVMGILRERPVLQSADVARLLLLVFSKDLYKEALECLEHASMTQETIIKARLVDFFNVLIVKPVGIRKTAALNLIRHIAKTHSGVMALIRTLGSEKPPVAAIAEEYFKSFEPPEMTIEEDKQARTALTALRDISGWKHKHIINTYLKNMKVPHCHSELKNPEKPNNG